MTVEALIPLYGGYTLSRGDGVVFIKGAIPGEVLEEEPLEKKRDYSVVGVRELLKASPDRIAPSCPVFGECGGCHYQFIAYPRQVSMKEEVVLDCLRRIAKVEAVLEPSLLSSPWHYRHKVQYKVSGDGRVGFYRALSHDVVSFQECLLLTARLNDTLNRLRSTGIPSGLRELTLQCGDIITAAVKGEDLDAGEVSDRLGNAGITGVTFPGGEVQGAGHIQLALDDYRFNISTGSFFQSNWALNLKLLNLLETYYSERMPERVVDLYSGAGNLSIPAARYAKEVVAVDGNRLSCRDGRANAALNRLRNIKFINKQVEDYTIDQGVDLLIVDPPRKGLPKRLLKRIVEARPGRILYLSCNPSTFSRDLKLIKEDYDMSSVRVIDMFPQTYHIELLGTFEAK